MFNPKCREIKEQNTKTNGQRDKMTTFTFLKVFCMGKKIFLFIGKALAKR